ncbi:hypothetical protein VFPFJ_02775 [Purpureocillium lilacinum]|uniref:Uncharacterized protein n=1 Tax=Purpureocillium lilacinum TaxID=33203 RepID=A0A179HW92_PURLI|nr:hypothetical protein VFPFJ_02775 [Purpureocillium lilacinum]OAQ93613.1 hypothetical protein VFPFJ_02775 [Purpureocillium lilacinum]
MRSLTPCACRSNGSQHLQLEADWGRRAWMGGPRRRGWQSGLTPRRRPLEQGALTCEGHGQGAEASGSGDMRCCLTCQRQQSTGAACGRVRMAHDHRQDWAAMQPRDPDGPAQRHARACACGRRCMYLGA